MEEEEDEPRLKYQRFGAGSSIPGILKSDSSSCLCVSPKILALGTHAGQVHLLDLNGNEVKRFHAHGATVNELCFDNRGEYVGSCSDDGTVVVTGLYTDEQSKYDYGRPIKTVALDPDYAVKKSRQFVSGGMAGNLVLNSKGWLGSRDHVLHSGEGTIHAVKWCGSLIAWANDAGVKMYDCTENQRITYIGRPKGSPRPDLFKAHLHWATDTLLLIGWADCVKVARVSTRSLAVSAGAGGDTSHLVATPGGIGEPSAAVRFVEIVASFQTDYYISGLAPLGESLVLLAYQSTPTSPDDAQPGHPGAPGKSAKAARKPELRVVTWANEELGTDILTMHGFEHYRANDYLLAFAHPALVAPIRAANTAAGEEGVSFKGGQWVEAEELLYYVVSPKDVVVGRPRDGRDRVLWLMQRDRYEEALATAEARQTTDPQLYEEVGRTYLEHSLATGKFARAVELCPRLLKDAAAWERWVFHFAQVQQLPALAPHIPTSSPRLRDKVYEVVLNAFLPNPQDHKQLLELVRGWPTQLYSVPAVIAAVQRRLATARTGATGVDLHELKEVLAELYMADGQRERALSIYLQLQRPGLFDFIHLHKLYAAAHDKVALLMALDADRALDLLVEQRHVIPAASVVAQLQAAPPAPTCQGGGTGGPDPKFFLHRYLAALFERDPTDGGDYHALMVESHAEYEPQKLMRFLTSSQFYPLEGALEVCRRKHMVKEQVYILGRMGSTREALTLIMTKLGDIEQAIEFVQGQQDDDLWEELIKHSLSSPALVGALLEHIGLYIDPLNLLRRLPEGMQIPKLRDRLVRIVADYRAQTSLRDGCNNILRADCAALSGKHHLEARRAVRLDDLCEGAPHAAMAEPHAHTRRCCVCVDPLLASSRATAVVFFCAHAYHLRCLKQQTSTSGISGPTVEEDDWRTCTGPTLVSGDKRGWSCALCYSARNSRSSSRGSGTGGTRAGAAREHVAAGEIGRSKSLERKARLKGEQ